MPDAFFAEAFDATLQPAATAGENEIFLYEVDWVEIRRLGGTPAPALDVSICLAVALLLVGIWVRAAGYSSVHGSI